MLSHSALTPMHVVLHKVQRRVSMLLALLGDWAAFIGVVLILGLGTSVQMVIQRALQVKAAKIN